VPRPGPKNLSRPAMLALAMYIWLAAPFGATPTWAAGCHVPDRPVLGASPTGHDDPHIAAWEMPDGGDVAPPVLRRVPCPGETPGAPASSILPIGPACLAVVASAPAVQFGSFLALEDVESLDPFPSRLDRPPR
jgi:hypothetical protein